MHTCSRLQVQLQEGVHGEGFIPYVGCRHLRVGGAWTSRCLKREGVCSDHSQRVGESSPPGACVSRAEWASGNGASTC